MAASSDVPLASHPGVSLAGPGPWERRTHIEPVWGTVVTFDLRAESFGPEVDAAIAAAVAFLHEVDDLFSTYRPETPISLLRNGIIPLFRAPQSVRDVLAACDHARVLTNGTFDPWSVPGGVDPSGYVKGWAAGVVADRLVKSGVRNVAINASGDIACRGEQSPGEPWSIGISNPYDTTQIIEVVRVGDGAVATSGLYERGQHIVDPATGRLETKAVSATVVGPDAGLADALATAALIAGTPAAQWFSQLPGWSLHLVVGDETYSLGPAFPAKDTQAG